MSRWEAGLEAESRPREGNFTPFFKITDKVGEPLVGSLPTGTFSRAEGGNEKAGTVFTEMEMPAAQTPAPPLVHDHQ